MTTLQENESQLAYKIRWITELKEKIALMVDGWGMDMTDGSHICAAVLFPDWSPELDVRRTILQLTMQLYPSKSLEVSDAKRDVENALHRVGKEEIGNWPEERLALAVSSFVAVAERARIIR